VRHLVNFPLSKKPQTAAIELLNVLQLPIGTQVAQLQTASLLVSLAKLMLCDVQSHKTMTDPTQAGSSAA